MTQPVHVIKCAGAPTLAPPEVGTHWVDTLNKNHYLSDGTDSVTNWVIWRNDGTTFTTFLSMLDTPNNFGAVGSIPLVNSAQDALVFGNQKIIDLADVNNAGLSDAQVWQYDAGTQTFTPDYRLNWKGTWQAGTYKTGQLVNDAGWSMIANKTTTARAAPEADGASAFALPDLPTWASATTSPISVQGLRFTVGSFSTLDGVRFWRNQNTGNESYSYLVKDITDPLNEIFLSSGSFSAGPVGWVEIGLPGSFFDTGQVIDIQFFTEISTASDVWTHTWTLQDNLGGLPAAQTYTVNADFTLLRINEDADGPINVAADLALLKIGDEITFFEFLSAGRFDTYQVSDTPTLNAGVYDVPVLRTGNGQTIRTGVLSQADATIKSGSQPAPYVSIGNFWFLNPPTNGTAVKGYLSTIGNDPAPSLTDDALGVDVRSHGWITSDDWDVLTTTLGGSGSGGSGGGSDTWLGLLDTPDSFSGQVGKLVAVRGDETALEFVDGTAPVASVFSRTGVVVAQSGDYSASQVGAYTVAQTDAADTASILAHTQEANPHPQYVLPSDLPSLVIAYLTGLTSTIDGAYIQLSPVTLGNVENSVTATTSTDDAPELIAQYLREPVFDVDGTLLETGSNVTLDIEATTSDLDCRIEIGVRRLNTTFEILGTTDLMTSQGRSTLTAVVTIPETDYFIGDTSFLRLYLIKKPGAPGGAVTINVYQEGSYTSRILTNVPGQSFPAPHATSHEIGGSDQVDHDLLLNANGFDSHATIDQKTGANLILSEQNETDILPLQLNSPPGYDQVAGKYLSLTQTAVDTFAITDGGSYGLSGTFRFTQASSTGSGQGTFGDAVISVGVVISATFRNFGSGHTVTDVLTLDIPDASPAVEATIQVNSLKPGQVWSDTPGAPVTSVFGRTGVVTAQSDDYQSDLITTAAQVNKFASQAQLDQISTNAGDITTNTTNIGTNATNIGNNTTAIGDVAGDLATHEANLANPHVVTKAQVGLGNADNTSDADKPISDLTQTALDGKEDAISLTISRAVISDNAGDLAASSVTSLELSYSDGVTSNIQTQLNGKQDAGGLAANRAMVTDGSGNQSVSTTTDAEIGFVDGVTSAIQPQIDSKEPTVAATTSADIYQGDKTFVPKLGLPISTATQAYVDNLDTLGNLKLTGQGWSETNTLVDAATIATDCDLGNVHQVTLTDNRTLGAPTNLKGGATYIWVISQDVGGTNTLAYNAVFKFPGGTAPVLSTAGSAVDILSGWSDGTNVYATLQKDFS